MQTKRQEEQHNLTAIQTLAAKAIEIIEHMYVFPNHKDPLIGEDILVTLKTNRYHCDIALFLSFYEAFCKLGKSTNSSTCRQLASFLFHAREIIVQEYNKISDVLAGRTLQKLSSVTRKVILENENALSLVDKRVILEEKLLTILKTLVSDLSVFEGLDEPLKVNTQNMLTIFESAWLKLNNEIIIAILTSEYAIKKMHALCDEWHINPGFRWSIGGLRHSSVNSFVEHKIWAEFNIVKFVFDTSWCMAYIDPYLLIGKLEKELSLCRESTSYNAVVLERIEFFLKKCMEKGDLDKNWLREQVACQCNNAQNKAQLGAVIAKCYAAKYVSPQHLLFFGSSDVNNPVHSIPGDVKKVLQAQCLNFLISEKSEMLQKINGIAEDDQPGKIWGV